MKKSFCVIHSGAMYSSKLLSLHPPKSTFPLTCGRLLLDVVKPGELTNDLMTHDPQAYAATAKVMGCLSGCCLEDHFPDPK